MSKRLPPALPDRLYNMLSGNRLNEQLNKVLLLITLDAAGFPYVMMLSFLEVIAVDRNNIRIAPAADSTSSANLRRDGKATLIVVDEEMAYYIQATAKEISRTLPGYPAMAKMNLHIESLLEDYARDYEGTARVTTGIRFESPQRDSGCIERGRQVLAALRQ